ncbi:MAG: ATP-dependent DNA helicase RecG [Candidatus Levybacteria bacterium RIFCSPLOWO2_12_FULL_37_7]|nr:MAG: ATP-dependent DNA helicase RecG [Candidatus Levybacteria bacterium RIFCSPLOWO2_12_FULL_37_7]
MNLKDKISNAERILKMYWSRLEKLGIYTFEDFLFHIPFRYEDYSLISKISRVQPGETVTIQGEVLEIKTQYTKRGKRIQRAKIQDDTAVLDVIWFNQPYLTRTIPQNSNISLSGKAELNGQKIIMQSPEYEILTPNNAEQNAEQRGKTIHTGRLVPIYPETHGISSKWLRRQVHRILTEHKNKLDEYLPYSIIEKNNFLEFKEAIEQIHFPKSIEYALKARQRLSFDELFLLHLASLSRKNQWKQSFPGFAFSVYEDKAKDFVNKFPFTLTISQKRATEEILNDLASDKPMNRLLEGDVGSGKTVVSAIAMYVAFLNGFQSTLMAPTEILANQHYNTISNLLAPFGVKVGLKTGSSKYRVSSIKKKKAKNILNTKYIIHNTDLDILIGTHAILSEKVKFDKLGLVIIDEQQRFGVEQRSIIRQKGKNPHLLTMTATPIPRTVALTIYGDLDLSYLDEMPIGRKKIKTWLVPTEKREAAYKWIETQIKQTDSQAFIICPFIEESESMNTVKAAKKEYERLKKEVFPHLRLGMLHGKMKAKEKEEMLTTFRDKKMDILVATPVVEVGIDIPNSTIIIIEASERFGLAQLHQLRGRVGRGDKQSYCLLFTQSESELAKKRLKSMETVHNGAALAELDLQLRGAGDVYGTLQHGKKQLKIASFSDFNLLEKVKKEAKNIFPELEKHPLLLEKLQSVSIKQVSPD